MIILMRVFSARITSFFRLTFPDLESTCSHCWHLKYLEWFRWPGLQVVGSQNFGSMNLMKGSDHGHICFACCSQNCAYLVSNLKRLAFESHFSSGHFVHPLHLKSLFNVHLIPSMCHITTYYSDIPHNNNFT